MCWWSAVGQDGGPGSVAAAQDDQSLHRGGVPAGTNTNCQILSFAILPNKVEQNIISLTGSAVRCKRVNHYVYLMSIKMMSSSYRVSYITFKLHP